MIVLPLPAGATHIPLLCSLIASTAACWYGLSVTFSVLSILYLLILTYYYLLHIIMQKPEFALDCQQANHRDIRLIKLR
jgi:hypothetical protein